MNLDDFKQAWRTQSPQTRMTVDPELLLNELRRNQRRFAATIFWRDVREVGLSLAMVPLWLFLGVLLSMPWTWYLTVPVLLWCAGYMTAYQIRHRRRPPEPGESLREAVERSLAEHEQQIRLLRNVFWWDLLPFLLSSTAFSRSPCRTRRPAGGRLSCSRCWSPLSRSCSLRCIG
ncbi:MAG: hypothetical protein H0T47_01445 [Planctomycetaceae bacterium]|nr:hypothetical protein [Planctomycetaceae bacterium]